MNEFVTVKQALMKGRIYIHFMPLLFFLFCMLFAVYLHMGQGFPDVWIAYGMGIGLLAFPLIRLIAMPKWRLWAVRNVRNVHELKRDAIQEKLWPVFSEKLEMWSGEDREEWRKLQRKFNQPDEYRDDFGIPKETVIYFSKVKTGFLFGFGIAALVSGIALALTEEKSTRGLVIAAIGLFFSILGGLKFFNRKPQLRIGNEGITTPKGLLYPWNVIFGEKADMSGYGKNAKHLLTFSHPEGEEQIKIENYDLHFRKIQELLNVYRARFDNR